MKPVFALVDCNNFYTSCERVFQPQFKNKPVLVLSSNDGCVIARSQETKALGIDMGIPVFKVRHLIEKHRIQVFSSNFSLYGDMSARVMTTLETLAPNVEIYSVDEAFLNLTGVDNCMSLVDFGQQVRRRVYRWVGIPTCVGIAPSKTLAKLANAAAKKHPDLKGVADLMEESDRRYWLSKMPVGDVWGVGRRLTQKLTGRDIKTALALAESDPKSLRKAFSVTLERTIRELNGEPCFSFEEIPAPQKQILCSRSFGERVTEYRHMKEAVCSYVVRACEKLRREDRDAKRITVFMRTSPYNGFEPFYGNSATGVFRVPGRDTRDFIAMAVRLLEGIWRDGYRYMKAGVVLFDFYESGHYQPGLFDRQFERPHSKELMQVIDRINHSGKGAVWFAGQGTHQAWRGRKALSSQHYTTNWEDILQVT